MKSYHYFFILFVLFISCTSKSNYSRQEKNDEMYVIDLDKGEILDTLYLTVLFKSVRCIPLEFTESSIIGNINKILVYKNNIYVHEAKARSLTVFDLDGHFIRKIGNRGQGPGEYINLSDFTIDTDNDDIILLDFMKVHMFSTLTGKYKKTINFKNDNNYDCNNIQYFNGMIYTDLYETNTNPKNESLVQCINLSTGKQEAKFLNARINNKGWNNPSFTIETGCFIPMIESPYLFRSMFMDTIFSITPQGLHPFIAIKSKDILSEHSLNSEIDFRLQPNQLGNFYISLKNSNKIFTFYSFFYRNDIIFLKYLKGNRDFSVLFDAKNNKTQIFKTIYNDLLFKNNSQIPFKVSFFDKTGLFCHLNVNLLPKFLEILDSNGLNDISKEQLKGLNDESNPVIFYYEFN